MDNNLPENQEVKNLNRWVIGLLVSTCLWVVGMCYYNTNITSGPTPMIETNFIEHLNITNLTSKMEKKEQYSLYDCIVINYFFVGGVIVEIHGDNYTVMYKNSTGILEKVVVNKDMLLTVKKAIAINPVLPLTH